MRIGKETLFYSNAQGWRLFFPLARQEREKVMTCGIVGLHLTNIPQFRTTDLAIEIFVKSINEVINLNGSNKMIGVIKR